MHVVHEEDPPASYPRGIGHAERPFHVRPSFVLFQARLRLRVDDTPKCEEVQGDAPVPRDLPGQKDRLIEPPLPEPPGVQGHGDEQFVVIDPERGVFAARHQAAELLPEGEVAAIFEGVNGIVQDRLIDAIGPGSVDGGPFHQAQAAEMIGSVLRGVGDPAGRAKGSRDQADIRATAGAERVPRTLRHDGTAGQAQRREEQLREGFDHRRHVTSPWAAI